MNSPNQAGSPAANNSPEDTLVTISSDFCHALHLALMAKFLRLVSESAWPHGPERSGAKSREKRGSPALVGQS
jgi:hypothetical protein